MADNTLAKKGDKYEFIDQSDIKLGFKGAWVIEEDQAPGQVYVLARNIVGFVHNINPAFMRRLEK